jgi:hypothetical protein
MAYEGHRLYRLKDEMRRTWFACLVSLSLGIAGWASTSAFGRPADLGAGSAPQDWAHELAGKQSAARGCPDGAASRSASAMTRGGWILIGQRQMGRVLGEDRAGAAQAFSFRASGSGQVSSIHVYVDPRSRASGLTVALYSNSRCRPRSRLTVGSLMMSTARSRRGHRRAGGGWRSVEVPAASIIAGRTYWLAVLARGGMLRFRDRNSTRCVSQLSQRIRMMSLPRSWQPGRAQRGCAITAYAAGTRSGFLEHPPGSPAGPPASPLPPPTANLWVSAAGGSCTRRATAGLEVVAQDCGSLAAAYRAADCGDIVNIDPGTYPQQSLVDEPSQDSCSSPIVFQGPPGVARSSVVLAGLDGGSGDRSASNWTLQNATVTTGFALWAPGNNITINQVQTGDLYMGGPTNVIVENSNLGPCYNLISLPAGQTNADGYPGPTYSPNPAVRCNSNIKLDSNGTLANITFKNDVIHDFLDDDSNSYYDHFECMFIDGGTNITVDGTRFYDCQIYAIFIQPFQGHPINGLTIQNNWFWADQGVMGACTSDGNCPAENAGGVHPDTVVFGDETSTDISNVLIRYNSFDPCCGIANEATAPAASQNVRAVGNVLGNTATNCISGVTYGYNMWLSQNNGGVKGCGTGDGVFGSSPFVTVSQQGEVRLDDLHLRCGSAAQNFVTPNTSDYQLGYDIDGNARNMSGPRDAGASAATSCGT